MALTRDRIYVGQTVICVEPYRRLVCGTKYTISHIWDHADTIQVDALPDSSWSFNRFDIADYCTPQELIDTLLLFAQWLVKPRPLQVGDHVHIIDLADDDDNADDANIYVIIAIYEDIAWVVVQKTNVSFLCPIKRLRYACPWL